MPVLSLLRFLCHSTVPIPTNRTFRISRSPSPSTSSMEGISDSFTFKLMLLVNPLVRRGNPGLKDLHFSFSPGLVMLTNTTMPNGSLVKISFLPSQLKSRSKIHWVTSAGKSASYSGANTNWLFWLRNVMSLLAMRSNKTRSCFVSPFKSIVFT